MGTKIWGKPQDGKAEVIDETYRGGDSAAYLVGEYCMAYRGWKIWSGLKRDEPNDTTETTRPSNYFS